jgi:ABC-type glycerol-3-phosphate transport system permease component
MYTSNGLERFFMRLSVALRESARVDGFDWIERRVSSLVSSG